MSGNPFRLSLQPTQPADHHRPAFSAPHAPSSRADASGQDVDTVIPSSTPRKPTKKVRIQSPTSSSTPHPGIPTHNDTLVPRSNIPNNIGSLLPAPPASSSDSKEDLDDYPSGAAAGRDGDQDETLMRNTMGPVRREGGDSGPTAASIPANPFQKTLATIEPSVKPAPYREAPLERSTPEKTHHGAYRASMDVDAFTRLLMTGSANPSGSGALAVPQNPSIAGIKVESSDSTDTSSISRQSIFEPIQESHSETPRTSYEMAASEDEDQTSLMGEPLEAEKKKPKPPPPKHRHGKLVASRTPQTVSFSDFSPSFVEPTPPPTFSHKSAGSPISNRSRTNSDLNMNMNKPLPPPPDPSYFPSEMHKTPQQSTPTNLPSPDPPSSSASSTQKRIPPAPPLTRRHSTLRSSTQSGPRSRSNSALTISSQLSDAPHEASHAYPPNSTSTTKPPPPPPPSRRHGAALISPNASASVSTTSIPSTSPSTGTVTSPPASIASAPPVPASRRSTFSSPPPSPSPGLARTASVASRNSYIYSPPPSSAEGHMAPPPPPPPRRRGRGSVEIDGRRSLDSQRPALPTISPEGSRRTSGETARRSFEGQRRASQASESSLRYEYVGGSAVPGAVVETPSELAEESRARGEDAVKRPGTGTANEASILDDMERLQREVDALREKYGGA